MSSPARWKKLGLWTRTEKVRQGTGQTDNFVVLVVSLLLLAMVAGGLAYYVYQMDRPTVGTGQR